MLIKENISFRKILESDYPYLLELYESTRTDVKLHGGHLTREQQMAFIKSQFELQDIHYKKFNPKADFLIVLQDGEQIGRLYKEELTSEVCVIEFTLHEKTRAKGIGSEIIKDIMAKAHEQNKKVTLHAARDSKEFKFYEKLGFKIAEDLGPYYKMTAKPQAAQLTANI